jgi:acetoin utilization deacetylase AcuC-like enzyme
MVKVYYSPAYISAREEFDTTRKSGWIAESLLHDPLPGIELHAPEAITETMLAKIHAPAYINAVKTGVPRSLAESQGFHWDPGLWTTACAHTAGMVNAAQTAFATKHISGSLSSGQHHAHVDHGAGFCTFNGIALAAHEAIRNGARRVLIIDLDAHCAGGTHGLIENEPRIQQLDIAISDFDGYTPRNPNMLVLIESAENYLSTLRSNLAELDNSNFDLCIYYAGMDPFEECYVGGLEGITFALLAEREQIVFEWCASRSLPVAFGLGGGYVNQNFPRQRLIALHRITLAAATVCNYNF